MNAPRSIKLYGTEEPSGELRPLRAGALEAMLDGGNLRYVRLGGIEALRGIAYLVRDRNWGTYVPEITDLQVREQADRFTVTYDALCRDAAQSLRYSARLEGRADGRLVFEATGEALTDFVTNRSGFVVLHPLEGVVDKPVAVEHTDGRVLESRFPALIDPACPFQDIRALTHEVSPGVHVTCRMEGEAFEMEDHRNWMDASYKTYVRPLAKPWPYTIPKGPIEPQKVTLAVNGHPAQPVIGARAGVTVQIGEPTGAVVPRLGLAAPAEHVGAALEKADILGRVGAGFVVCHFDARKGHGAEEMRRFAQLGEALGVELVLEAVVACQDADGAPSADPAVLARDMAVIRDAAAGVPFARVAVSPASDLKCTLPGSVFPPAPSWEDIFRAARAAFPGVPVGGGMFSYFTELNRKRPPAELLDFICHSSCPIVHAGDDLSVTENLEALPSIFRTVRSFAGGKPYWVFPTAISMRDNPYGAAPAENPNNVRQAMNRVDPRDRALLGAAWYAGYMAHAARAGVEAVTLAAAAGPSGVVYSRQAHAQPWFDEARPAAMPSFQVLAAYCSLQGAAVLGTEVGSGAEVQALAAEGPQGRTLVLANLTGAERSLRIDGLSGPVRARVLDETNFEEACMYPLGVPDREVDPASLTLSAYAVAVLLPD